MDARRSNSPKSSIITQMISKVSDQMNNSLCLIEHDFVMTLFALLHKRYVYVIRDRRSWDGRTFPSHRNELEGTNVDFLLSTAGGKGLYQRKRTKLVQYMHDNIPPSSLAIIHRGGNRCSANLGVLKSTVPTFNESCTGIFSPRG